jgi:Leucine-rich repeat (LRR) protein
MDNRIVKIIGLESCKLLEELSLEKNKISVIENLSHLKYLKKLDLG